MLPKKLCYLTILSLSLFFIGCSTTSSPSSTGYSSTESADILHSQGIEDENNVVGSDGGPQDGLLGIRSFYFAFDSSVVDEKDKAALQEHAQYLIQHSPAKIVIQGNTDIRGSREYNIGLGQRRAEAVASILRMDGVSAKQIRTLSYGAEKPIALGHTEEAYRLNRRSDIVYETN